MLLDYPVAVDVLEMLNANDQEMLDRVCVLGPDITSVH